MTKIDWQEQKKVTKVKNQGQCGSCWAFGAVAAIESAYLIKNNKEILLSEQQLVDCGHPYLNHGCAGGLIDRAFHYVMDIPL